MIESADLFRFLVQVEAIVPQAGGVAGARCEASGLSKSREQCPRPLCGIPTTFDLVAPEVLSGQPVDLLGCDRLHAILSSFLTWPLSLFAERRSLVFSLEGGEME